MMCKADISEANNSIHKIMALLSSLSPLENAMINSQYIIPLTDCAEICCKFCKFCKILYRPINVSLSTGEIGRAFYTYTSLFISLRYKERGRGFDSQWSNCDFLFT